MFHIEYTREYKKSNRVWFKSIIFLESINLEYNEYIEYNSLIEYKSQIEYKQSHRVYLRVQGIK